MRDFVQFHPKCMVGSEAQISVLSLPMCFRPTGVLLISLALCADAAIGNVQEKAMKLHNGSNSEMVTVTVNPAEKSFDVLCHFCPV